MEIKAISHLGRFKDIVMTLFKYGFDDVVERFDLPGKMIIEKIYSPYEHMTTWQRIRYTLEELGPTFVKFGQVLSLRPDLIPPPLVLELQKLQDEVTAESYEDIREVLQKNLTKPIEEVFEIFEETPVAGASLAQVHRAVLKEGRQAVAVKIQRPGITQKIDTDLYILSVLAHKLHERMESMEIYNLPELVEEFKKNLMYELDFRRETRNMKISQGNLSQMKDIRVPGVYDEYCTEQMITMELIEGVRLKDLEPQTLHERESIARRGLQLTIKQVLEDGFFHADPHPGNIFIVDKKVICLLDWGTVGRLTQEIRFELTDLLKAVVERDSEGILEILLRICSHDEVVSERLLQREILDILDACHNVPLGEVNISELLFEITELLRKHRIRLPSDLAIMIKTLMTAEGTARQLYPGLNVVAEAEPFVEKLALDRWKPENLFRGFRRSLGRFYNLQKKVPVGLQRIVGKVDRGELTIQFQHKNLEELQGTLENIANRVTIGLIIAAMIIGSSMVITTGVRPFLFGYPAFGIVGYLISAVMGLWLIYNIIRARKF